MKTNIFFLALTIGLLALSSCKKDKELDRVKFLGTYSVNEDCASTGDDSYDLVISASPTNEKTILIENLYDWEETFSATVSGDDLTISNQKQDGLTFNGSGKLSGQTLTINFKTDDDLGINDNDCTAICTKTL